MPNRRKVGANLVGSPRVKYCFEQRAVFESSNNAPVGSRLAAFAGASGHACPPARVARNRQRDRAGVAPHLSVHQGQINLLDVSRAKLLREMLMRAVISRHNHRT